MMTVLIFLVITYAKNGSVSIYFKNLLQKCINFEIAGKACSFISFYRSHSQSKDEFKFFADNLELNLN